MTGLPSSANGAERFLGEYWKPETMGVKPAEVGTVVVPVVIVVVPPLTVCVLVVNTVLVLVVVVTIVVVAAVATTVVIVEVVVTVVLTGAGVMVVVGVEADLQIKVRGMVRAYDVDLTDAGDFVAYAVLHRLCVL